jgi:putative ABC transport system permease protein
VEQGLAETLNLKLGDRDLTYDIAGVPLDRNASPALRKLDWDSMRVNFFVIASPRWCSTDYPASYITSFHLPADKRSSLATGTGPQPFPTSPSIDVAAAGAGSCMRQIRPAWRAPCSWYSVSTVLAGLAVLYAALVRPAADERRHELAVHARTGRPQQAIVRRALLAEFAALGALAGLLAGIAASLIGWALARFAFRLDYLPQVELWLVGLLAGTVLVVVAGWLGASSMLRQSALPALRAAQ